MQYFCSCCFRFAIYFFYLANSWGIWGKDNSFCLSFSLHSSLYCLKFSLCKQKFLNHLTKAALHTLRCAPKGIWIFWSHYFCQLGCDCDWFSQHWYEWMLFLWKATGAQKGMWLTAFGPSLPMNDAKWLLSPALHKICRSRMTKLWCSWSEFLPANKVQTLTGKLLILEAAASPFCATNLKAVPCPCFLRLQCSRYFMLPFASTKGAGRDAGCCRPFNCLKLLGASEN